MKKNVLYLINFIFLLYCTTAFSQSSVGTTGVQYQISPQHAPKIIIYQEKVWLCSQNDKGAGEIITYSVNDKDTILSHYDNFIFACGAHPFLNTTVSWDIVSNNLYGLQGLGIRFNPGYCYGASGSLRKISIQELSIWASGNENKKEFNYQRSFALAEVGGLPISSWFEKKYYEPFLNNRRHRTASIYPYQPFGIIADSVIKNTYFDFFKLRLDDSTAFFALCEGNVLSTWHFTRSKQQKLHEYPFKSTGYVHVLEHQGKPYLISAEGTVFKLGRQMKKVQQLPRPLKEGWLIVDKDHDKIYFLEQNGFSFADKPRAMSEILKKAFVLF